jgi:hypothetical protein
MEVRMTWAGAQAPADVLSQIRYKENHGDWRGAITGWRFVEDRETNGDLAVEALCTFFVGGAADLDDLGLATDLVSELLRKWLDFSSIRKGMGLSEILENQAYQPDEFPHFCGHDPVLVTQLVAAAALHRLVCGDYAGAASTFLAVAGGLGPSLQKVITPADVGLYGALCALAVFDYGRVKADVSQGVFFRRFLDANVAAKRLVAEMVARNYAGVVEMLAALEGHARHDVFLSPHRTALFNAILKNAMEAYASPPGPLVDTTALYERSISLSAMEAETTARGQTLRTAMAATDGRMAQQKISALRADLTLQLYQSSVADDPAGGGDPADGIVIMMDGIEEMGLADRPLQEFGQKYRHARKRMDAASGALIFVHDIKAKRRIAAEEAKVKPLQSGDAPREGVAPVTVEHITAALKGAVLALGRSAASNAARHDARHRLEIAQAALLAVTVVRSAMKGVHTTAGALEAMDRLIEQQAGVAAQFVELKQVEADASAVWDAVVAAIRKHHHECGVLDFFDREHRRKQEEEATVRLKEKSESRMRVRMKTRAKELAYKKAKDVALAAAQAEAEAERTLKEMLRIADELRALSEEKLAEVVHANMESMAITVLKSPGALKCA